MTSTKPFRAPLLVLVALLVPGCLPIPDVRLPLEVAPVSYRVDPAAVPTQKLTFEGTPEPHTPERYNRSYALRYALDEPTDTVVLLMPGIFGGAASFDPLARQLVASTPGLEVWALDRRSNALEDRAAFRGAVEAREPDRALDHYLRRAGTPDGFRPPSAAEVSFVAYWGLDVHLGDLHEAVLAARRLAPRVVLGGHSLGASLVSVYASYEVGGGRHGGDLLDGLLLLDGTLGRTGGFERQLSGLGIGPLRISPTLEALERGDAVPYMNLAVTPWTFVRRELIATLAWLEPDALAPPELADFPITNLALAGIGADDAYGVVPLFDASVGEAVGADFSGNLLAFLLGGADAVGSRSVVGVAAGADAVTWSSGDPARERTDLRALLRAWVSPGADYAEWYFPIRLAYDLTALAAPLDGVPGFAPTREVTVPTLALGAGRGLVDRVDGFTTYANLRYGSPVTAYVLPGLTHIDIVTARDNPVVPVTVRWLRSIVGGG